MLFQELFDFVQVISPHLKTGLMMPPPEREVGCSCGLLAQLLAHSVHGGYSSSAADSCSLLEQCW